MWPFDLKRKIHRIETVIDDIQEEQFHAKIWRNQIDTELDLIGIRKPDNNENDGNDLVQAIINLLVILVLVLTIIYYVKQWKNV